MNNSYASSNSSIILGAVVPSLRTSNILNEYLRDLLVAADVHFDPKKPESFEKLRNSFKKIVSSDCIKTIVYHELDASIKNPMHRTSGAGLAKVLIIAESEKFQLTCQISNKKNTENSSTLKTLPSNAFFGNIGENKVKFEQYETPRDWVPALFKKGEKLLKIDDEILTTGDILYVDACKVVLIDQSDRSNLQLILTSKAYLPLIWIFDRNNFSSVMSSSAHEQYSRMQIAALAIANIWHEDSTYDVAQTVDALATMTRSSVHFVRWSALQALCVVDPALGMQLLLKARSDPHAHIQCAAIKALEKIDKINKDYR